MLSGRLVITGVAGCGKTSLARALAADSRGVCIDADDLHPPANRARMAAGEPLREADRLPWLRKVADAARSADGDPVLVACSALKRRYRDLLRRAAACRFVYLHITPELARARVASRAEHFFSPDLVASQFACLEQPGQYMVDECRRYLTGEPLRWQVTQEAAARMA
ncbi:MAG: gluconokinase, GntK/IdnK-type [Planctomycetota bacterium]